MSDNEGDRKLALVGQQSEPSRLVPDAERAEQLRNHVRAHLELLAKLMNDAERDGMRVFFQIGRDNFGRNVISSLDVMKVL